MLWFLLIGGLGIYYFFWRGISNRSKRRNKRKNYRDNLKYRLHTEREKDKASN